MSSAKNRHGLSRDIPADVARQVRQQCGFGCVICGRLPYTYDHFDPEFVDATKHDAEGIALLCFNHHADRKGRLSVETVKTYRRNPACLRTGTGRYERPIFLGKDVTFDLGGTRFTGRRCQLALLDRVLFGITAPEVADEPWTFDGELHTNHGAAVLKFRDDVLELVTDQWDVTLEGQALQINRAARDVVARVDFDADAAVVRLTRLKLEYAAGLTLEIGSDFIELRNLRHTRLNNECRCLRIESSQVVGRRDYQGRQGAIIDLGGGLAPGDPEYEEPYGNRFGNLTVRESVGIGADGVADLSAIATLRALLSPDQLASETAKQADAPRLTSASASLEPCPCGSGQVFADCHGAAEEDSLS